MFSRPFCLGTICARPNAALRDVVPYQTRMRAAYVYTIRAAQLYTQQGTAIAKMRGAVFAGNKPAGNLTDSYGVVSHRYMYDNVLSSSENQVCIITCQFF